MSSFHHSFGEGQFGATPISWLRFTHRSILDYFNEPLINQRFFSVVGRSQLIEAISETLLTEFTVNGSVHRSIPDYSSSQWFASLIKLRTEPETDKAPYRFLKRFQTVFELTLLRILTILAADNQKWTSTDVFVGYELIGRLNSSRGLLADVRIDMSGSPPLQLALCPSPALADLVLNDVDHSFGSKLDAELIAITMVWALIRGIWSGSQFVPGTVETFATILKAKWEYIDTKTQFRPTTMYGDFWSRDKTTVWQQYLFS